MIKPRLLMLLILILATADRARAGTKRITVDTVLNKYRYITIPSKNQLFSHFL